MRGKAKNARWLYGIAVDHPRVCGEKGSDERDYADQWGSPPRVRGKELVSPCILCPYRITPACAGKSVSFDVARAVHKDHPRVCGEKKYLLLF